MYTYRAEVIRWIDGDTLLLEIDLGFYIKRMERIRLARINTPELNSQKTSYVRKAKHARAVGRKFCPNGSIVKIETHKMKQDMYARYVAEVFFKEINLSDYLLKKGVAKKWNP